MGHHFCLGSEYHSSTFSLRLNICVFCLKSKGCSPEFLLRIIVVSAHPVKSIMHMCTLKWVLKSCQPNSLPKTWPNKIFIILFCFLFVSLFSQAKNNSASSHRCRHCVSYVEYIYIFGVIQFGMLWLECTKSLYLVH